MCYNVLEILHGFGVMAVSKSAALQVAVVEDNPDDAALLESYISGSGIASEYRVFNSAGEFLQALRTGRFDLVFLDIYMDDTAHGLEVADRIRKRDKDTVIAFVTGSPDHTRDGYRFGALKYLDKPVTADGVKESLELALMKRNSRPLISIRLAGGGQEEVTIDNIVYCEQRVHSVEIHLTDRVLTTSQSMRMDNMQQCLPSPPFVRSHKSFLVNLDHVSHVDREIPAFHMENGDNVYIRQRDAGKCARYERQLNEWRMSKIWVDEAN